MTRIAFLHTAEVHAQTFGSLLKGLAPEVSQSHTVRAEWLAAAQRTGLTDDLRDRVRQLLRDRATEADAVLCTCSTLGPVVDEMRASHGNIVRIDRPMMERAAGHAGTVMVAYCLDSTLQPTLALLRSIFRERSRDGTAVPVSCAEAWPCFERGDMDGFAENISHRVRRALGDEADAACVVLAQASMAAAEPLLADLGLPVYSSPRLAVEAVLSAAIEG